MHETIQEKALELEVRKNLYSLIVKSPGLHFREIQRRIKMATGHLTHHLNYLQKVNLITTRSNGEYLRYYAITSISNKERKILELIRQKSIRHIILYLLEHKKCNHQELTKSLDLSPATISWHIKKLVDRKIVEKEVLGRNSVYSINDYDLVKKTLVKYKDSFLDKIVDRFIDGWET